MLQLVVLRVPLLTRSALPVPGSPARQTICVLLVGHIRTGTQITINCLKLFLSGEENIRYYEPQT